MENVIYNRPEEAAPLAIYIHIPFCVRKCSYCDFLSFPADQTAKALYMDALCRNIREAGPRLPHRRVNTIFIGGGTPSVLPPGLAEKLLAALNESFTLDVNCEVTIEVNPGTLSSDFLRVCKAGGVNRISMGLQSLNEDELALLGRIHSPADFYEGYELCRRLGFDNINVDLISGLPGQISEVFKNTLSGVCSLEPEHISAYSLILEEGTPLYERYADNPPDEDTDRYIYEYTGSYLSEKGYERYEISNYAIKEHRCRHNITYWKRGDYLGFGIGAASCYSNVRYKNTTSLKDYINGCKESFLASPLFHDVPGTAIVDSNTINFPNVSYMSSATPDTAIINDISDIKIYDGEPAVRILNTQDIMEETMILGLRMMEGVSKSSFFKAFGSDIHEVYGSVIDTYKASGHIKEEGDRLFLTPTGINVSNYILADFLL